MKKMLVLLLCVNFLASMFTIEVMTERFDHDQDIRFLNLQADMQALQERIARLEANLAGVD